MRFGLVQGDSFRKSEVEASASEVCHPKGNAPSRELKRYVARLWPESIVNMNSYLLPPKIERKENNASHAFVPTPERKLFVVKSRERPLA